MKKHQVILISIMAAAISAGLGSRSIALTVPVSADTTLVEELPDNNMGGHTHVAAGTTGILTDRRGLFLFDLSDIPPGTPVLAASFHVAVVGTPLFGDVNSNFSLYRLLNDWGEGEGIGNVGMPASEGDATWLSNHHSVELWSSPGGDFSPQPSATTFVAGLGQYTWSGPGLLVDVQSFVDNSDQNFGWILISDLEGTSRTARRFGSQEGGRSATLEIELLAPPCDFTGEAACTPEDIDQLMLEIIDVAQGGTPDLAFDLTGDNNVTVADRDKWLELAGAENLMSGNPFQVADTNLDGIVDGIDFTAWNSNKFTFSDPIAPWQNGEWDGNGFVDGGDFTFWNLNKFNFIGPRPVPEPSAVELLTVTVITLAASVRRSTFRSLTTMPPSASSEAI